MSKPIVKMPQMIRDALDATGLVWTAVPGKRHNKVYLHGLCIAVLPRGTKNEAPRQIENTLATIRRAARSIKKGMPE